jgi:hypothetical protein
MTIAETLLPRLNEWESSGPGRQHWSQALADTGWSAHLSADRVDTLGCLLWEATLVRTGSSETASNAALKEQAARIVDRVTGLMEPLHFLELDETQGVALLRSDMPAKRGAALSYYEILMTRGRQINLKRYQVDPDKSSRRTQVAFALTHEAIAKLVDDLIR